jgi:ribosomal protein L36
MIIKSNIKPLCDNCRVVRRNGKVVIIHKDAGSRANHS